MFREFITELIATQGVEAPGMSIPAPLAHAMAVSCEGIWRTLRLKSTPPMTRLAYWLLALDTTIDISQRPRGARLPAGQDDRGRDGRATWQPDCCRQTELGFF